MRPKVYKLQKKLKFWEDGEWSKNGGFEWSKNDFQTTPPPLLCYNCLKPATISHLNIPKITLKVILDEQTFYPKILS